MNIIQTIDNFNTNNNFNTINSFQLNNTSGKIKLVFGNHNVLQLFMRYITNTSDHLILPPFSPVMARSICVSHPNATFINSKYIHQSLMKKLSTELLSKYPLYSMLT